LTYPLLILTVYLFLNPDYKHEFTVNEHSTFHSQPFPFQDATMGYPNGLNPQATPETMSPDILAAVRQQMCNMVDAANFVAGFNLPPNMTIQSMTPQGNLGVNIPNPKAASPAMSGMNKNGGEPNNVLQMPRLGSPAMQNLPTELSMHGLQNSSPNDDEFRKKERNRMRKDQSLDDEFSHLEDQKNLNNRLSITKLNSPKNHTKSPSLEALEPAVNLAISGQSLDMSFKSSRHSSDGSINGEDSSPHSFRSSNLGFKDSSPIKLEPLADCRE
jgi:hypothetical protein